MKKIVFTILLLFSFITVFAIPVSIESEKVLLVNMDDNTVLYEKDADEKSQIASITKVITAITILDNTDDLDEIVTIKKEMLDGLDGYSKVGLKVNDQITIRELLYALMLPSAGDAAQALAINKSGSIQEFAKLMNNEIKKIGVKNTSFSNPVGFDDENNYSTANDLYKILKYALNNNTFKKLYETKEYHIESLNKDIEKTVTMVAKQGKFDASIIKGAKTGYTDEAGKCLTSTATINGANLLLINLNAPIDSFAYIMDAINIYNYYSYNYGYKTIYNKDSLIYNIDIDNSLKKEYDIKFDKDIKIFINNDIDINDIEIEYDGINPINKDIKFSDKLGSINFKYNDDILYTKDVYLDENIIYYNPVIIISLIGGFILLIIITVKIKNNKK